jgi:hypothetical protein
MKGSYYFMTRIYGILAFSIISILICSSGMCQIYFYLIYEYNIIYCTVSCWILGENGDRESVSNGGI